MPVLSNLFVLFIDLFKDNKPAPRNKATYEKCGRNLSAVQPIKTFKERLSAPSQS